MDNKVIVPVSVELGVNISNIENAIATRLTKTILESVSTSLIEPHHENKLTEDAKAIVKEAALEFMEKHEAQIINAAANHITARMNEHDNLKRKMKEILAGMTDAMERNKEEER